jgi:cellobiose-specific phosphotransferase system component IIC
MKKNKLPSLILILILTLLTGVIWVSLEVYRTLTIKPAESVPEAVSNPINPILDQNIIKKIESAVFIDRSQIPDNVALTSTPNPNQPALTPIPTLVPLVTPSASPGAVLQSP